MINTENDMRATYAQTVITAFVRDTGMNNEDDQTILADLLANLMHWCDRNPANFESCLYDARMHYAAEVEE